MVGGKGNAQRARRRVERFPTKLNADKTRFDPGPVGVPLTFCFRNCSRPLPVRYERTPSVPGCQSPFDRFAEVAPGPHCSFAVLSRRTTSMRSITTMEPRTSAAARKAPRAARPSTCCLQFNCEGERAFRWRCELAERGVGIVGWLPVPRPQDQSRAEALQFVTTWGRRICCSPKAERRQSRLASKPSAFCWLSASGISPVGVWLTMNVHPACQNVNTHFFANSENPPRLPRCEHGGRHSRRRTLA
jgi:hypothetical protein